MKSQKLCIIGAGSTYTIGMIMSLIKEKTVFPLSKIVFYDIDSKRQDLNWQATKVILNELYPEMQVFFQTTDPQEAFIDIDVFFIQIRTGGLKMRIEDERIPLSLGAVGQETCGPGGMAYGLRSIPDMIELIESIRLINPSAWILNYTNPAAIVAEALKRKFPSDYRILNICDMPVVIMNSMAAIIGKEVWEIEAEYFGLNHFGWFKRILGQDGVDYTEQIKEHIASGSFQPKDSDIANDASWQNTFEQVSIMLQDFPDYIPNTYLQYYLYPDKMVRKEDPNNVRAMQVIHGREKNVSTLCHQIIDQGQLEGIALHSDVHGEYMVRAAASLAFNLGNDFIVIVENHGVIENFSKGAMVEVTAKLTSRGPIPYVVGEIPAFYKGLMENQYAYETCVVDAYFQKDYRKLLQALVLNRTVIDTDLAKQILESLYVANKAYWHMDKDRR